MTTIKSVTGPHELAVSVGTPSHGTYLRLGNLRTGADGMSASFPTADLLAALNAVPESDLFEAGEAYAKQAEELRVAEAECDALAKTVERVREALSRHPEPCAETEFTCGWKGAVVDLRAALDPQPALPTEPGSVIIATFDCIDTIYTKPIRRLRNGGWSTLDEKQIFMDSDCIKEWKPAKVVEA